jgi:Zn-dependent protease/CBS domain-containing protein
MLFFMPRSFKLITVFGIPIEINYTWFIIVGLVIFTLAQGVFPQSNPELPPLFHWIMATIAALLLFASLVAHELSHSLVAMRNRLPIHGITLFVFGGVAHLEKEPDSPAVEFKMAIAGPLMSFALALLFLLCGSLLSFLHSPSYIISICDYLLWINLAVGIFNLIPGFPLDGGRVLRSLVWAYTKNLKRATGVASAFGKGFAFFLMALGIINLFGGGLISGVWFIFIGFFLQEAADMSYRQVVMNKILTGVRVENIMTRDVITVPYNLFLEQLLERYFFRFRFASFPVIEDDHLIGLITLHDIKEIERSRWGQITAKEAMIPLSSALVIDKDAEVTQALTQMASSRIGRLLVVENSKLIGIVSQRDIMRLFEFKSEIDEED